MSYLCNIIIQIKSTTMKTIIEKYENLQRLVIVLDAINNCNNGNYEVYFDANFMECDESEVEANEYKYTSRDESEIRDLQKIAYDELINAFTKLNYTVTTPYESSIYITKDGRNAISIRNHDVKPSTLSHWDSVYGINILKTDLTIETLTKILS